MSISKLIECAKKSQEVMSYLPDESELTAKRVSKEFIATIINSLDPTFFPEAIKTANDMRLLKLKKN